MRVLLIDNYDSFAYNLVQALGTLGAEVLVRRNDAVDVGAALALSPDAVVISPGPCTPAEAGVSVDLVRAADREGLPLLGVCLGHQAIGVAFGGRVVGADRLLHGKTCTVHHDAGPLYAGLPPTFPAMRYHSLVVESPLPDVLVRSAWTEPRALSDQGDLGPAREELMGARHRTRPIEGVQFHPESFMTPAGPAILGNFLDLARSSGRT